MPQNYSIVEAQLPILGLAGHNLFVLLDPNGKVLGEIDGLATDSSGNIQAVGNSSDGLISYFFPGKQYYDSSQAQTSTEAQQTIASGPQRAT